jgi:hypothetical protein
LWLTLILTPNLTAEMPTPRPDATKRVSHTPTLAERNIVIRAKMCAYALKYRTMPEYVMAVGNIESRKGEYEFRIGKTGRYYQPMGIHELFLKQRGWPVDTLDGNIEVGARALAGIDNERDLKWRLRRYNATFNESYWKEVCRAIDRYSERGALSR